MKSNIHPTLSQALGPFFQAVGAVDPMPRPSGRPAPKKGIERGFWTPPGRKLPDLAVDYLEFAALYGRRDEAGQQLDPDIPAGVEIQAVWLDSHDILGLLSDELIDELERVFGPSRG